MGVGHSGSLPFVTDTNSGRRFLCDTGAQVSILPASDLDVQQGGRGLVLEAANGSPIQTFDKRDAVVCFGGQRFKWDFVVAKVSTRLLGADFLCTNGLLVDVRNQHLIKAEIFNSLPCALSGSSSSKLSSALSASDDYQASGTREARCRQSRVCGAGEPGHCSTLKQPMGLTSTHCAEAWRWMAPVWGLPSPQ